jgi:uncharacterized protein (TIGR02217 family)
MAAADEILMPFLDIYMPEEVPGYPCVSAPRTKTTIQVDAGGNERTNQEWEHPLMKFVMPEGVRQWAVVQALGKMWRITAGPYKSFAWRDPLDFSSDDLLAPNPETDPVPTMLDQALGTGDGFTDSFQLIKRYSYSSQTYDRPIYLPILSTVVIADNGSPVSSSDYTVSRPGGIVTFDTPPTAGHTLTAGFLFDVEVRFESDDAFEGILRTWQAGGFADITLIEKRPC